MCSARNCGGMRKARNRRVSESAPAPGSKRCARTLPNRPTRNCRFTAGCHTSLKTNAPQPGRLKQTEFGTLPPGSFKRAKPGAHAIPVDEIRASTPIRKTQHDDGHTGIRRPARFHRAGFCLADVGLASRAPPHTHSSAAYPATNSSAPPLLRILTSAQTLPARPPMSEFAPREQGGGGDEEATQHAFTLAVPAWLIL